MLDPSQLCYWFGLLSCFGDRDFAHSSPTPTAAERFGFGLVLAAAQGWQGRCRHWIRRTEVDQPSDALFFLFPPSLTRLGLILLLLQYLAEFFFHMARLVYFTDENNEKL